MPLLKFQPSYLINTQ